MKTYISDNMCHFTYIIYIPPTNGLIALWPSTNGAIPYFLVLPGSELSITEITEYIYFSPLKPRREFKYESEYNTVPVDLIIESVFFLWNIICTFYYTRVGHSAITPFLGGVYVTDIYICICNTHLWFTYEDMYIRLVSFTCVDTYNRHIAFMNADKYIRNMSFTYADAHNVTCTTAATIDTYVPDICWHAAATHTCIHTCTGTHHLHM